MDIPQKRRSYVSRAISLEISKTRQRQLALAERCHITQPSLWAIMNSDVRLSPETLRALTHCWDDPDANVRVLIAHLRDEIKRADHDPVNAVDIRLPNGQYAKTQAEHDLDVLRAHISDEDVAAFVRAITNVILRADAAKHAHSIRAADRAADPPAEPYGGGPKKRD